VLFTEASTTRLQLREVEGHDIVIIGMGGTKHRAILCEVLKITATLVKKGSGEIVLESICFDSGKYKCDWPY
jgi:dihydroorotate dehydrogenase